MAVSLAAEPAVCVGGTSSVPLHEGTSMVEHFQNHIRSKSSKTKALSELQSLNSENLGCFVQLDVPKLWKIQQSSSRNMLPQPWLVPFPFLEGPSMEQPRAGHEILNSTGGTSDWRKMKGQRDEGQQDRESPRGDLPSRGSLRGLPKTSEGIPFATCFSLAVYISEVFGGPLGNPLGGSSRTLLVLLPLIVLLLHVSPI